MAIRVAINGFGRIGRGYLRASLGNPDIDVVAVNDLTSPEVNAHLLRYDSTQGSLDVPVAITNDGMTVGTKTIKVLAERNPAELPWAAMNVDVVIESTGRFTTRESAAQHLSGRRAQGHHLGAGDRRRRHVRHRRQRRHLRPGDAPRRLQRLVHDELLRADGEGARRRLWRRRPG